MPAVARRALAKGMEWEYDDLILPRDMSRNAATRFLAERAETGGWELRRLRIGPDGVRRAQLRRKIIRQQQRTFYFVA